MAERTIDYLKSKFETGDKPSQQDFIDLIDTLNKSQTKLFVEFPISSGINAESVHRVCRLDNERKVAVWQPLPPAPGSGGEWTFKFNTLTDKETANKSSVTVLKFIDNPAEDDTFTFNYTATEGASITSAVFTFKDSPTGDMEIERHPSDIWENMFRLYTKIQAYITANSLSGRMAITQTYNVSIAIYCEQFSSEPNNVWYVEYKPTEDPVYDTNEFAGGSSGAPTTINFFSGTLYASYWNADATTPEEEAQAFADYINEGAANAYFAATVDGDTTTLTATDFSVPNYNISLATSAPEDAITFTEVEAYVAPTNSQVGYTAQGVIDSIDLANQKCLVQVAGKALVKLAADAAIPCNIEAFNTAIEGGVQGVAFKLVAVANGEVKVLADLVESSSIENIEFFIFSVSNYIIGTPISNAAAGQMVEVILTPGSSQ